LWMRRAGEDLGCGGQQGCAGGQLQAVGVAGAEEDGDAIDVECFAETLGDGGDEGSNS